LNFIRHIVQIVAFIGLNAKLFGLSSTGFIVPYLHATQAPFSSAIGGYESLEFTISKGLFPLLSLGVLFLTAILVGRVFCGWACPIGLVQDLLTYLPFKKTKKLAPSTESSLKNFNLIVLAASLFVSILVGLRRTVDPYENPIDAMSDGAFSIFSPSGTLFAYIPWLIVWKHNIFATAGIYVWLKIFTLVAFIVPSLYIPRFFCRFVCPVGPLLGSVSAYKMLFQVKKNPAITSLDHINAVLDNTCPMGVKVNDINETFITSPNCIHCGNCVVSSSGSTIFSV